MKSVDTVNGLLNAEREEVIVLEGLVADIQIDLKSEYDRGFVEGSQSINSDVVYTEEEYQAGISAAIAPLSQQILDQQSIIEEIPVKIQQAEVDLKAVLAQKYQDAQVVESQVETGFAEYLK